MTADEKQREARIEASMQLRITHRQMKLASYLLQEVGDELAAKHADELDAAAKMVRQWAKDVLKP